MAGVLIYAAGFVTNELTFRESVKDPRHDFLGFTMAHNNGFIDDNGVWQQTSTLWLNVKAFGALARNARSVIAKGRPVMVHGELKHETFDGADGNKHSSLDLKADAIGLNLRLCGSAYTGSGERNRSAGAGVAAAGGSDLPGSDAPGADGPGSALAGEPHSRGAADSAVVVPIANGLANADVAPAF